jgi:outer membrane protein OmpA-like peptidoglycan-associated protein
MAGVLAGCGGNTARPSDALAIVVGAHSNMPGGALDGTALAARERALDSQAYLAIVVADGQPFIAGQPGRLLARHSNSVIQRRDRDANRQLVDTELADAKAKTPETDLLSALDVASRTISSQPGHHTIVVLDSGLSTVAPLDFRTPGLIDSDPAELAASLKTARQLPDLAGDDVVFQGLGDTAAPQVELGRPQRAGLIDIWVAIAKAAGAHAVQVEKSPLSAKPQTGLPPVSPVVLDKGISCTATVVTLTGGDVGFLPDSAEFKDRAAATAVIEPIAKQLRGAQVTATLTGTTADVGAKAGQVRLSEQRAQAVAALLAGLGVPADRLTVIGRGSDFPGYLVDHDGSGNLIPAAAARNRKVIIDLAGGSASGFCA